MRIFFFFIFIYYFSACKNIPSQEIPENSNMMLRDTFIKNFYTTQIFDANGNMIEEFGNEGKSDNPSYFHMYLTYDSTGKILSKKYFYLGEKNKECLIKDSLDYSEIRYIYEANKLVKEEEYLPIEITGRIVGHRLSSIFYVEENRSEILD